MSFHGNNDAREKELEKSHMCTYRKYNGRTHTCSYIRSIGQCNDAWIYPDTCEYALTESAYAAQLAAEQTVKIQERLLKSQISQMATPAAKSQVNENSVSEGIKSPAVNININIDFKDLDDDTKKLILEMISGNNR